VKDAVINIAILVLEMRHNISRNWACSKVVCGQIHYLQISIMQLCAAI
jgi:hypothetical protein